MSQPTRVLFLRRGLYDGDRVHGVLQQPANPWFPGIPHSEGVSRSYPEKNRDSYPDQAISVQRSGANALQGPDRELTDMFRAFQWHYRFQPIFCNVGRGHEKGSVENKVGYVRRNFLSPIVCIDDFATFNAELSEQLIQDMQRPHYEKNRLIAELWEEDRERLLMLPNSPF